MSLDPTTVRVSETTLLSDYVGCDSVYRRGFANPVTWGKRSPYFKEAKKLGARLDDAFEQFGSFSIAYGYICPELSKKIVKYQDPNKPSYHRWDHGAAADVCFHDIVWADVAPITVAAEASWEWSRFISYSESEWVCIATRVCEHSPERNALYENRYVGEKKPQYIRYSENAKTRRNQLQNIPEDVSWRGAGYPTYHGGGRQQFHHIRLSRTVVLSDLLYRAKYVHRGVKNLPPVTHDDKMDAFMAKALRIANCIETVIDQTSGRLSVVSGYDRQKCWSENEAVIEVVPHLVSAEDVADILVDHGLEAEVRTARSGVERVRFYV